MAVEKQEMDKAVEKLTYWEHKILDLSLRNGLISMSLNRRTLPVMADMEQLEQFIGGLQAGRSYKVWTASELWNSPSESEAAPNDPERLAKDCSLPESKDLDGQGICIREYHDRISADMKQGWIRILLREKECLSRLRTIRRNAHTFMEESGANVLYLAVGLLKWFSSPGDAHYAPLVLIPLKFQKKMAGADYRLAIGEDEYQFNITLLELLKRQFDIEIDGAQGIPLNEKGIPEFGAVFQTVREAVRDRQDWEVLERAFIGIFSFGQFVIWKDIHDHGKEYAAQPLVASLIEGHMTWKPKQVFKTAGELDHRLTPEELVVPVSADSSQLAAIDAAMAGESFVMHGPPGTGKSQTITNIIANTLYQGRSVLFLSRKLPALEVVQKRLEEIGLGAFCLELHGDKTSRRHVLEQFKETLELAAPGHDSLYGRTASQITEERRKLRSMIEQLHQPMDCGLSFYDMMNLQEQYQDAPDGVRFGDRAIQVSKGGLEDWKRQLEMLGETATRLSGLSEHPLKGIGRMAFTYHEKQQLLRQIDEWFSIYGRLDRQLREMLDIVGIDDFRVEPSRRYMSLADVLAHMVVYDEKLAELLDEDIAWEDICRACAEIDKMQIILDEIQADYKQEILRADIKRLLDGWELTEGKMDFLAIGTRKRVIGILRKYAFRPKEITEANVGARLRRLIRVQDKYEQNGSMSELARRLYEQTCAQDRDTWPKQWNRMQKVLARLGSLELNRKEYGMAYDYINRQAFEPDRDFNENRNIFLGLGETYADLKEHTENLMSLAGYTYDKKRYRLSDILFDRQWRDGLSGWKAHIDELDDWCCYLRERDQAIGMGLEPVTEALEKGLSPDKIIPAFYKGWAGACAAKMAENNVRLQYFNGSSYEQSMGKYRKLCRAFEMMTRQEIRARLTERLPNRGEGSDSRDFAILQKAIMGGGFRMSIRQLFTKMPEAVRMLAPCMLMSPASVAQYIDLDFPKFDLVIIDEASQLPTCEAVGALARGRAVVIAGDEQQLPPTGFFRKKADQDDIERDDLESILDDALALNMPQCCLNWHYRSAHESLIAFSNFMYYDHGLRTFPSVDDRISAVKLVNTGGVYDRSVTRTNPREAERVIEELERRVCQDNNQSIGVITFNIQQCNLIEEKWEKRLEDDRRLAEAAEAMSPPIFIKNLENIQGDERDVILFSLGFGPDAEGNMTMNFGPINQTGGHRRLNVAITRARQEMMVFASFDSSDIRVTESSPRGLKDLKAFITYAGEGRESLSKGENVKFQNKGCVSQWIADSLREKGYEADINVGSSDFRMDVAVRDPREPGRYLLGVLLDDDRTALQDTVNDRVILQKDVLKRMGWQTMNIWMLDWWKDRDAQLLRIETALMDCMEQCG